MSFFYASPVEGEMHLHDLENAVKDRIEFLKSLVTGRQLKYSEYILEGSAYDNAGHFTLYIIDSLSRNSELSNLIRKGEIKLFERRLSYLNPESLQIFAKKILRYVKKKKISHGYSDALYLLCSKLALPQVARHLCTNHSDTCSRHTINPHFTHCLAFISKRLIELKNGKAAIPCSMWMEYLTLLFKAHLNARDKGMREHLHYFTNDDRIMSIAAQYVTYGNGDDVSVATDINVLRSRNVDAESQYFPPCMKNLLNELRKNHRLSHDQRFYLTCFLKDIGMPISEAVEFWKEEYSNVSCTSSCQHTWSANGAKYIQSLRHTYGLEGSRTSYSCAGCKKIQSSSGARGEGGCPFKDFSNENMIKVLTPKFISPCSVTRMETYRLKGNYIKACMFYLNTVFPKCEKSDEDTSENVTFYLSPVKFYLRAVQSQNM